MYSHDITLPKSIADICRDRADALAMARQAYQLLNAAEATLKALSNLIWPFDAHPRNSLDETTREIDRRLWRHAFDKTGLMQYMDAQARREFERDLDKAPPEFTEDNCRSVLLSTAQQTDLMFASGLYNVFSALSKHHRTNTREPFKVNSKAILEWATTSWCGRIRLRYGSINDQLNDIDRVIRTLDGKPHHAMALSTAINGAFAAGQPAYEDAYYRIKGYKSGTLHIEFKRRDLLDKANRVIADYCGAALADGSR